MPDVAADLQLRFLRSADAIRGFVTGLAGGDLALADDVFQEVFLVVTRRAEDFRPDGDFIAWVRGIAKRKLLELARKRSCGLPSDVVELLAVEAPPDEDWDLHRRALRRCVAELAPRAREIAELRFLHALEAPAIATRLRWTVNAVRVALSRLRQTLRTCAERRIAEDA